MSGPGYAMIEANEQAAFKFYLTRCQQLDDEWGHALSCIPQHPVAELMSLLDSHHMRGDAL